MHRLAVQNRNERAFDHHTGIRSGDDYTLRFCVAPPPASMPVISFSHSLIADSISITLDALSVQCSRSSSRKEEENQFTQVERNRR